MTEILTAVIPVVIIGIICAVVLVVASKLMAVKEDERFPAVRDCLPGANCGACGFAGCDGYAKALCEDSTTPTNLCIPGADSTAHQLSDVLGVEFADVEEQVAFVHCNGNCDATTDKVLYQGIRSCAAAKLMYGGKGSCIYGCLGLGDCASVCPQEAIRVINGVAKVDPEECIGCGMCAAACPNKLITMVPAVAGVFVECSNRDKGAVTRKVCSNGCIGCKKCEKLCPNEAIKVVDNVARIDYSRCTGCGACAEGCTTHCITLK